MRAPQPHEDTSNTHKPQAKIIPNLSFLVSVQPENSKHVYRENKQLVCVSRENFSSSNFKQKIEKFIHDFQWLYDWETTEITFQVIESAEKAVVKVL